MMMRKFSLVWALLPLLLEVGALPVWAQDEPQAPAQSVPKPAGTAFPVPVVNTGDQSGENDNNLRPDTTPLTGVLAPTLGTPEIPHSYWVPGIQYSGTIQSNPYNQQKTSSWLLNNYFVGNLSVLKVWRASQFAVNYSAGGFISTNSTQGNGYYQQLALSQTFQWRRLQLQFLDQFAYLPQSSLGFGGGTGLGIPGVGGSVGPVIPGMGNNYSPNDSIYAAVGPRFNNAAVIQATYTTSPRGSITASGSYGILHFVDKGNVDNDTVTGTIGYNYLLTQEDTIGAFYRFSGYHFNGQPQAYGDNSFNVAYGRKLTGRLALQLYGGPDITTFRVAVAGDTKRYGANVGANLNYGIKDGGFTLGYSHGISGGSGVLAGSSGDQLNFSATHRLGRVWSGQMTAGFAHNAPLKSVAGVASQTYNTWTVGAGVNRPVTRYSTVAIAYNATVTDYGQAGCTGSACTSSQTYHYVTVNFQWHTRPFILP